MSITRKQSDSGIIIKAPTYNQRFIDTDLIAQDTIVTPGSTSNVEDEDIYVERHTSAEAIREHRVATYPSMGGRAVIGYEVSDESIASVDDEGNVTWNGDAVGEVTVLVKSAWGLSRTESRLVGYEESTTIDKFLSWVDGSLAKAASEAIDNRIAGLSPDTSIKIFDDTYPSSLVRNELCWASDIDLSGISPKNSKLSYRGAGTLITPRDILLASHYPGSLIGETVYFVKMDGTVVGMEVASYADVDGGWSSPKWVDLRIATFTEDVPSGITPVKIPPANLPDYLRNIGNFDYGVPCIGLDQEEKATIRDLYKLGTEETGWVTGNTKCRRPTDDQRRAFYEDLINYDSGNPALMVGDFGSGADELMILTVWTGGGGGSGEAVYARLDEIDTALAATGSPYRTSDNLADLSGYTNYA